MVFKYQKNADDLFVCPHCNETKKNQNTMHYHLKKHEGSLPHTCKHCSKKFLHKNMLDLHISARHPETTADNEKTNFCCNSCDYSSLTKSNRLIHFMRVHCRDITSKNKDGDSCKVCSKEFNNSTAFYYHTVKCCPPKEGHNAYINFIALTNE